ncbi:hypothetical protein GALMADRAFT_217574, partial [Galerina marginata CBS 339.88]
MSYPPRVPITSNAPPSTGGLHVSSSSSNYNLFQSGRSSVHRSDLSAEGHPQTPPSAQSSARSTHFDHIISTAPLPESSFLMAPPSQTSLGSLHPSHVFGQVGAHQVTSLWSHSSYEASAEYSHDKTYANTIQLGRLTASIKEMITELRDIPNAYTFVGPSHPYKTGPDMSYLHPVHILPIQIDAANKIDPFKAVSIIETAEFNLPTYGEMAAMPEFRREFEKLDKYEDIPTEVMMRLETIRDEITTVANEIRHGPLSPTPSTFALGYNWHARQLDDNLAIMCHRPAYRRPKVPLKLKHVSFSKFFHVLYDPSPTGDELQELRVASDELGGVLNSHPKSQKELADTLMPVWRTILPNSGERLWRRGVRIKGDRGFVEDLYCEQDGTPHVVICCRVDPGSSGDSYMRLCRLYDTY